jgi:hypothetical protein
LGEGGPRELSDDRGANAAIKQGGAHRHS